MKILLIIFILVVPFQVYGDDLSGNKIVCSEKMDEGERGIYLNILVYAQTLICLH